MPRPSSWPGSPPPGGTDTSRATPSRWCRWCRPSEGRFRRWGKWAEYDRWLERTAPAARRLGRSDAVRSVGLGRTITVPVDVHNWSVDAAERLGHGEPAPEPLRGGPQPALRSARPRSHRDRALPRHRTRTRPSHGGPSRSTLPVTTTSSARGSSSASPPAVRRTGHGDPAGHHGTDRHAQASSSEYPGPQLDLGRIWQGSSSCTGPSDCGVDGGTAIHAGRRP